MSNKSSGSAFEHDLAQYMSRRGWWAHIFQDNRNGQPFDIVLARDGRTQVGDCKVCEDDVFRLSRMEPNQISAMTYWVECGNEDPWYFILLEMSDLVVSIRFSDLMKARKAGVKSLNADQMQEMGELLCRDWEKRKLRGIGL